MANQNPLAYTGRVSASTTTEGTAQFDATQFTVTDGVVSLTPGTDPTITIECDIGTATAVSGAFQFSPAIGYTTFASGNTFEMTQVLPTSVPLGGTGRTSLTDGSILIGNSTANVELVGPLTDGQLLIGHTSNQTPSAATLTAGTGITVTNAAGSITIAIAESTLNTATVTLTAAEVKALATTPIELVAAPAAGKMLKFMGAVFKLVYGSEVFTESGDNLGIKYTDASGVQVSNTIETTGFIDQSADTYTNAEPAADAIVVATGAEAQALVLDNLGSNIAGNASNDSTLVVNVSYRVVEI